MSIDDEVRAIAKAEAAAAVAAHVAQYHGTVPVPPDPPVPPSGGVVLPARFAAAKEIWRFKPGPVGSVGAAAAPGWNVFDGPARQNGEGAYFLPANMSVVDGGVLRLAARKQTVGQMLYSGAMMENTSLRVGRGKAWFLSCRFRWDPYWGCWVGPWAYNFDNGPNYTREIDLCESVNFIGPTFNAHVTQDGPQLGSKSTRPDATFDVKQFHDYGCGVDTTGVYSYVDGVERTADGSWWAQQFIGALLWPKFQHSLLGWWPRDDAQSNGKNADTEIAVALASPRFVDLAHYVAFEMP